MNLVGVATDYLYYVWLYYSTNWQQANLNNRFYVKQAIISAKEDCMA